MRPKSTATIEPWGPPTCADVDSRVEALVSSYEQTASGIATTQQALEDQLRSIESTAQVVQQQLASATASSGGGSFVGAGKVVGEKRVAAIEKEAGAGTRPLQQSPSKADQRHRPY